MTQPAQIVAGFIFGSIGFVAFMYGKSQSNLKQMLIGVALVVYPYIVPWTLAIYAVGIVLTALLFIQRD